MIYEFLADGFEEMEAVIPLDVLKRSRVNIKTVSVNSDDFVSGAHKIVKVKSDIKIAEVNKENIDGIILPGGMPGTENLFKEKKLHDLIEYCIKNEKIIACICAAPIILGRLGFLKGKNVCCYPGFEDELKGAQISSNSICEDGNIITAKGPGVSLQFALKILEKISGIEVVKEAKLAMQCL